MKADVEPAGFRRRHLVGRAVTPGAEERADRGLLAQSTRPGCEVEGRPFGSVSPFSWRETSDRHVQAVLDPFQGEAGVDRLHVR
jgi:hypothetical protein